MLIILFLLTHIPDVNEDESAVDIHTIGTEFSTSVLKHRHFSMSIVAQFFYVGAQVGVGSFFIRYAKYVTGMNEKNAAFLWGSIAMVGFMVGRFAGTVLMKYINPARLLSVYAAVNVLLLLVALNTKGNISLYAILTVPFFMSIMYPTIFALGIKGLGKETKIASSFLVMSIIGGAVAPLMMGLVSDWSGSIQTAYIIPMICFIVVLYFGLKGHKVILHSATLDTTINPHLAKIKA